MAMKLRWNGSREAVRQYEEALKQHPPHPKKKARHKKKRHKGNQPAPFVGNLPYDEYLLTRWWIERRHRRIARARYRCEHCGSSGLLVVHHKHYQCLGKERDEDLVVLCRPCHEYQHSNDMETVEHLRSIQE